MNNSPLKIQNILRGKLGNLLNRIMLHKTKDNSLFPEYTLQKDLTPSYTNKENRVGLYVDNKTNVVVIKNVCFSIKNLDAYYLRNEAYILQLLSKTQSGKTITPSFVAFKEGENKSSLITKYFNGKKLEEYSYDTQYKILSKILLTLQEVSKELQNDKVYKTLFRHPALYLLSFLLNIFRVITKNPTSVTQYVKIAFIFYRNYYQTLFGMYTQGLVHRDLYPDNILYSSINNQIKIIDWESTTISDHLYDLAQISMIYLKDFGTEKILELVQSHVTTKNEKRRYIALSIFNSIQILALHKKSNPVFAQTEAFLQTLIQDISPRLLYKQTFFERVYYSTLQCIRLFYTFTHFPMYSDKKGIILCYHSIGNSGWRFATRSKDFIDHIAFLQDHYKLIYLQDILNGKNGVHITFDDGYEDVIQNALPILEKEQIPATMFALGDYKSANRKELDNTLPIMQYDHLKLLSKKGWEIGFHTKTHSNLRELSDQELASEIISGKEMLEKKLGFPIKYVAYPKGIYSDKIISYVKKAGFQAAFTVDGYDVGKKIKNNFMISRVCLEGDTSKEALGALLSPLGLMTSHFFMHALKVKSAFFFKIRALLPKKIHTHRIHKRSHDSLVSTSFTVILLAIFLSLFIKGAKSTNLLYQYDYNTQVGGPFEASNSTSRYALTQAIVLDRTFFLNTNLARFSSPDVVQYKGKYLSIFTPGVSFLGIPFYLFGSYFHAPQLGTYTLTLLIAVCNVFLIMRLSKKLGAGELSGLIAGIAFLLGTNALTYSLTFTQHHVSIFFILLGLLNALEQRTWTRNFFLGVYLGIGVLVDIPNLFMMTPLILFVIFSHFTLHRIGEKTKVIFKLSIFSLLAGLLPFIMLFAWYNHSTTGSYTKIGQTIGRTTSFTIPSQLTPKIVATTDTDKAPASVGIALPFETRLQLGGFYTLLLSDERSWWYYSPIVLLGILGIILLYKNKNNVAYATLIVSIILTNICLYSMFGDPWGGWAFGPRYLLPSAALLCVFLGVAIEKLKKNPVFILLFFILVGYSMYVNFLGALTTSSIPPRIEAQSLSQPIPYTYAYNMQLLTKGAGSSLIFNLFLNHILSLQQFLFALVGSALCIMIGLYLDLLSFIRSE